MIEKMDLKDGRKLKWEKNKKINVAKGRDRLRELE